MKRIEEFEEKVNVIKKMYDNDYIERLRERDNKYFNEVINRYEILVTDDGLIVPIELEKYSIDSTMWFDDEQPIPEKTEELFIAYNSRKAKAFTNIDSYGLTFVKTLRNRENDIEKSKYVRAVERLGCYDYSDIVRRLNEDEQNEILKIYNEHEEKYIERLHRYWKRYNSKIHCCGYWVNR